MNTAHPCTLSPPRRARTVSTWRALIHTRDGDGVRVRAMADGIRAIGGIPVFSQDLQIDGLRFAVSWGASITDAAWRDQVRAAGLPLLIMELGYLKRCQGSGDPEGYSQLGLGHIGWVPGSACAADRWLGLGMAIAEPVQRSGPWDRLLILGQVPHDAQHGLDAPRLGRWLTSAARQFIAEGFEIFYRPHPRHTLMRIDVPHRILKPQDFTLAQCFAQASAVLTYNSTAGVEAILAGLPVACHASAHYAEIANGSDRSRPAVEAYLHRLAYAQWTCGELATGAPLQFLNRFAPLLP